MAVNIVTGMVGDDHITSHDDRARHAAQFGRGKYVFPVGERFSAEKISENLVRIKDGMCINQGTQMGIEPNDYTDVEIDNGITGVNRHDLICMRYTKNADTGIENASLVVVKGTSGSEPTDPDVIEGNILDGGDLEDDMPLFRVVIEGITITNIVPVFEVFDGGNDKIEELEQEIDRLSDDVTDLNNAMGGISRDVSALQGNVSTLQGNVSSLQSTVTNHTTSITGLEGDIDSLGGRMNTAESDIDTLETNQTQILSDIDALEHSLSTTKTATGNPISISNSAHVNAEKLVVTLEPIQSGSGDPSPENIRPISGYDETSVVVKDTAENPTVTDTYTLQFGDTVYGAEVDFVKGVVTVTHGYIAEYAGETLPSTWISDRDVYASGTTPTTGAQVAYKLATPYTIQLAPQQIKMLKGNNVLIADGDMDLTYQEDSVVGDVKEWAEEHFIPYNSYKTPPVYGFHIDGNNSDPSSRVTYIADNANYTPAYMDYTTDKFRYGSWRDIWFVKECKPCILNQDGTVKAYLNPNDYTKDVDGNTVVIDENLTNANVMIEFPKIWYKVVPDAGDATSASVYFSPVKVDEDYKDYAYIDKDGVHKEHFYMPAYNGSVLSGTTVMRSLSGQAVSKDLDASTEIAYAKANGDGWNTEDAGEAMLINFLLILLGKSTDTQTVFGRGIDSGGETAFNNYVTGSGNLKGLFYGTNTGTGLVKVFGIENWWGLQWRRYAGDVLDNGVRKVKLCYGNEDGSTTFDFNIDGTGYVDVGVTPSGTNSGYIRTMKFTHDGMYSAISDGSSSTYYCDGQWFNNTYHTIYTIRGGYSDYGVHCGAFCVTLYSSPRSRYWGTGAAVSYK